ncbi:EAL domain-containing protein [Marichromatium bheemlicum]|uniref:EAL domain-containing protein n=1 Tax=Marichromatium bheemlicum TaxID=365339 RepID=A0ABX1I6X8_9GAMM|nr:EAL domain-containing protein [Marichromatium bheemlicum]NKN33320.1 EAL domain-containing protein [Marichromatium bheemlicum]
MSRMRLSRLQLKLWLGVGVVVLAGFLALQIDHQHTLRQLVLEQVRDDARTLHTVLLAAHRGHYRSLTDAPPAGSGFLPQPVIGRLAEAVQGEGGARGLHFETVTLRARSPGHQADPDEIEAIRFFERNPDARDRLVERSDASGAGLYHYAQPIWVEPDCLACHGARADAPAPIAAHYDGGFGYQPGELRGILGVRIPQTVVEARAETMWVGSMLDQLVIFPLMLLVGGILLQRFVVDKVVRLETAAHALAAEREVAPLPCAGGDELDDLARAFNRMSVQTLARARALHEERAFLQHVIDGIDDPILVIGLDYQVLRMNRVARELVRDRGLEPGISCHELWQGRKQPCGDVQHRCPLQRVIETQAPSKVVHQHTDEAGLTRSFEVVASPLYDDDARVIGIIEVSREITERLHLLARLEASDQANTQLTRYDLLTGLPNRALFSERLGFAIEQARMRGDALAVLIIDLDRFKHINDSFDHSDGDRILKRVANRLRGLFGAGDTLARMGGDEFGVILRGLRDREQATATAHRINAAFTAPFELQGHTLVLGASIGISLYPEHGARGDDLIRNADAALYRAKAGGGGGFAYYTAELTVHAFEQVLLEGNLRQALADESFVLYYQPQLELDGERLHGLEALVRWQHPELGLVAPDKFIPLAEDSGLIIPLGRWVLTEACRQMAEWRQAGLVPEEAMMCVNLSTKQFADHDLIGVIQRTLQETGLAAAMLELEVTESVMMRASDQVIPQLERLRALGVKVALDDFGTGYSSLSYLKRLPFTKLKIDRSFVSELPEDASDVAITKAIIALAESLSLEVLAEGVETPAQCRFLLDHGCRLGQGYLYSKPLAAAVCTRYLSALSEAAAAGTS